MHFEYNEDQIAIRDSMQKYLLENYDFEQRQAYVNADESFNQSVWAQYAELGWTYLPFEESLGGFGGSPVDTMLLFEEFGKHLIVEPYLETIMLAAKTLEKSDCAKKSEILEAVMAGNKQLAFAHYEGAHRGKLDNVAATASASGEAIVLNGHKSFVINADVADYFVVSAQAQGVLSLFLVPADAGGINLSTYATKHGKVAAELVLKDVELGVESKIAEGDRALALLNDVVDEATVALIAEMVGAMEVLISATVEYSKDREQFGTPIGKFQVLQHMMADMFMAKELSRSLMYAAAIKLRDKTGDASKFVSAAKAKADNCARQVAHAAVQIHGGIGTTDELKISHYLKRILVNRDLLGSTDYHLQRFKDYNQA